MDTTQKWGLKIDAVVGTSSARRKAQMAHFRNDVTLKDLRGNVPTRIQKLRDGGYDAILLAKAGIDRLGLDLSEFHCVTLDPTEFVPAPAQGVLGLQIRSEDHELHALLQQMNHDAVQERIGLERRILNLLDGGCQLPLGVYCTEENVLHVSYAKAFDQPCTVRKYTVSNFDGLAEKVIADLQV